MYQIPRIKFLVIRSINSGQANLLLMKEACSEKKEGHGTLRMKRTLPAM
jgi:hypothetical protein